MKLAEYLQAHRITRAAFGARVGVTHGAVSKWCGGARPDWPQMLAIHDATGGAVTPNDWLPAPQAEGGQPAAAAA